MLSLNAEVLWQADFTEDMGGFSVKKEKPADSVKAENGELEMQFSKGINKGIEIARKIPYPEKGELSFDAVINVGNKSGYGAWSLKMNLFGKLLAWNGSSNLGFCLYSPQAPPSNWISLSKIPNNRKVNYRIRYDRTKGTFELFLDGSLVSVKSLKNLKFAKPLDGKGELRFGNYGYASVNLMHRISNLKLETVSASAQPAEPKVVWSEKFEKEGSPADNGFTLAVDNRKDQFTIRDGVLTMVCQNSPYKGTRYKRNVPGLLRGELTFEASTGSGTEYNHFSLVMNMGGLFLSWHSPSAWLIFHPKENRWQTLTALLKNGSWHKYKIRFDALSRKAEFYVDDMANPVFIDENSEYVPRREVTFQIANYGLCSGTIVNRLRNIELKAVPVKQKGDTALKGTMIFRGISDTYWPLKKLADSLGEKEVSEFFLQIPPHHTKNSNIHFGLQPKPNPYRSSAKYIILADMPATPIPPYTLKMIRHAVEEGGVLIVLDGMFTLQKGEYAGTVLEDILPVSVKDPWGEASPLPGSEIFKHNGRTAVVSRMTGKGKVCVVLGNVIKDRSIADVLKHYKF